MSEKKAAFYTEQSKYVQEIYFAIQAISFHIDLNLLFIHEYFFQCVTEDAGRHFFKSSEIECCS